MTPERGSLPKISLIDRHVGQKLRALREATPLTLDELARKLDVTSITLADYEVGASRCPASTLCVASKVLKVHLAVFFEDFEKMTPN